MRANYKQKMPSGTVRRMAEKQALVSVSMAATAAALYAVYSRRHCVTDVQKLYDDIIKVYTMPELMGKQITDWDVEDLLTKKCGIDWERLEKVVEYAR